MLDYWYYLKWIHTENNIYCIHLFKPLTWIVIAQYFSPAMLVTTDSCRLNSNRVSSLCRCVTPTTSMHINRAPVDVVGNEHFHLHETISKEISGIQIMVKDKELVQWYNSARCWFQWILRSNFYQQTVCFCVELWWRVWFSYVTILQYF